MGALHTLVLLATPAIYGASAPVISKVANAEGEGPAIAPNTWVEIKGSNLSPSGDSRIWQGPDFVNGQLPTQLDGVSVAVNGKAAFVYYISPTQVNVLTPPDAISGLVQVTVTNNGASASAAAQAETISPSFFVFGDGIHVAAIHADGSLLGPASMSVPGYTFTPAKPGETISIYANGLGATSAPVVTGSLSQSGTLSPPPAVAIGGVSATVTFAGLVSPGLYQLNVVVPRNAPGGDEPVVAAYNGSSTQAGTLLTLTGSAPATPVTFYVAPSGKDSWSGSLPSANASATDGPFATFERARAAVQALNKTGLKQVTVQFRGGTYSLSAPVQFGPADSGSPSSNIVYENYPGETPVFSGGVRVQNWTNTGANTWKTTLPASTQYFENLFYNGTRRLRPRLGSGAANGALGAYLRVAATIYLNTAGPPAAAPDPNCSVYISGSGWECFDRFRFDPADPVSAAWKNLAASAGNPCGQPAGNPAIAGDIEVLDWEQFSTSKLRVSCIDTANHIVYLTGPTAISQSKPSEVGFIAGNRYMVDNVQDALTGGGQWFLDRSATPWTLTYLASSGENPNTDTVIIPQAPQILTASGLQYVTFQGLTFEHDNYTIPATGHKSSELERDIPAAVSFQNSQHITFDSGTVTQISGTGLEFISCLNGMSPDYCLANNLNAVTANNTVQNSAFFDLGALGVRIGDPFIQADTDANSPQFNIVQNNVVEGYGRTIPASFGIGQGEGHDNLYTHNDVYDGYHCAISISEQAGDNTKPNGMGNANNTISFNHVYNLLQGIMNDGGSIRIEAGNNVYTAPGNKILNNRIHDTSDASALDSNGYGGNGIYLDNQTGLVDVENNLVYRVSGYTIYTPQGPAAVNEANTIRNNILAFGRQAMIAITDPYPFGVPAAIPQVYSVSSNLFLFDRSNTSVPKFFVQGGCIYPGGVAFTQFQFFTSNLYWRTDGAFASEPKAFAVQPDPASAGPNAPCSGNTNLWNFYTFTQWQTKVGEDPQSVVQNPGFANPTYPADDFSLPKGSPGVGFVVFDPSQAGRTNAVLKPPAIPPAFPIKPYNPATDF